MHIKNHKQAITVIEGNTYLESNPQIFFELKDLVEHYPRSYCRKINAKGRKREENPILQHKHIAIWIDAVIPDCLKSSFYTTATKVAWILQNLHDFPKCKTCQSDEVFKKQNINPFVTYQKHCSIKCSANDPDVQQQIADTKEDRYGDLHFVNPEKAKKTYQKHKAEDPHFVENIVKKRRKTSIKNYGADNCMKSEKGKLEYQLAFQEKHNGAKCPFEIEGFYDNLKQQNNEKYGCDWYVQTAEFKEKSKQTFAKTYDGATCAVQVDSIFKKIVGRYKYDGKYFSSAPEIAFYIWLKDNNIEFEYQPKIRLQYRHNGKNHIYKPDFLIDGQLVEIKGSHFLKDDGTWQNPFDHSEDDLYEAKHQCALANDVKILYSNDYNKYVDYVIDKYGIDFLGSLKMSK